MDKRWNVLQGAVGCFEEERPTKRTPDRLTPLAGVVVVYHNFLAYRHRFSNRQQVTQTVGRLSLNEKVRKHEHFKRIKWRKR